MTTITIEAIEAEHKKIGAMIAALKAQPAFPITIPLSPVGEGEKFVGVIISGDGSRRHSLILLPGEIDSASWKKANEWAASIGGELPDRCESALLFATMKDEFKPEWYWTREQHVSDSDYAWGQLFNDGFQGNGLKSTSYRARAVRRLSI